MPARDRIIADLRASIEAIERRPALARNRAEGPSLPGGRLQGVPDLSEVGAGTLNEVFADATRDAGAALGFCLYQARGLLTPERCAVLFLQTARRGAGDGPALRAGPLRLRPRSASRWRSSGSIRSPRCCGRWRRRRAAPTSPPSSAISPGGTGRSISPPRGASGSGPRPSGWRCSCCATDGRARRARRISAGMSPRRRARRRTFDARAPGTVRYRVTLEKGGQRLAAAGGGTPSGRLSGFGSEPKMGFADGVRGRCYRRDGTAPGRPAGGAICR